MYQTWKNINTSGIHLECVKTDNVLLKNNAKKRTEKLCQTWMIVLDDSYAPGGRSRRV